MNLPERIRAFVSLNLPEDICQRVAEVQRELKAFGRSDSVRWVAPAQIHLTLKFLGNIRSAAVPELDAALHRACLDLSAFELQAEGLGEFPDFERPRVLWVGLAGGLDSLRSLRDNVLRETGDWGEREEREFHPHLTIARIKDPRPREMRELAAKIKSLPILRLGGWRVSDIHLMRSELTLDGSRHTCLATVPLGGGA